MADTMKKNEVKTVNCEECGVMYELKCLSDGSDPDVPDMKDITVHSYCPFCGLILA